MLRNALRSTNREPRALAAYLILVASILPNLGCRSATTESAPMAQSTRAATLSPSRPAESTAASTSTAALTSAAVPTSTVASTSAAPTAEDPALVGIWKPCARNGECEAGQECVAVGKAGEGRCALKTPSDLVIIASKGEQDRVVVNPRYLGKLLVLQNARLRSLSICTLKGCTKGCCNLCSEYVRLDSQAFQTDAGRLKPSVRQAAEPVLCAAHNECVTTTCPRTWGLDQYREVVGSFRDDEDFELLSPWLSFPPDPAERDRKAHPEPDAGKK